MCSFLRHLTLIFYLSKVTKNIFPQVIFDVKFPGLFKSAVKNRGYRLRKGSSFLYLTLKIYLKVKIDSTVKCPPRSWSTFVQTIFSQIKYFRRYLGLQKKKFCFFILSFHLNTIVFAIKATNKRYKLCIFRIISKNRVKSESMNNLLTI